ncbi:MAG: flagellar export chaperone FlgN [Bacteriovorax sp.]|nr:flagellar export chaperone FlgN [Bacteriovorax sp.]
MNEKLAILYFEVTDLWKRLCEEHNELFNITCDEYSLLLSSELSLLEEKLVEKNNIILRISSLETIRRELIKELNSIFPEKEIDSVSKLLEIMKTYEVENKQKHLFRFNALLIDIIEKIQAQNKRNQLFINKALLSLKQIRIEATGKKNYSTYSSKGSALSSST